MRVRTISFDVQAQSGQSFACVAPDARIFHSFSRVPLRVRLPDTRTGQDMDVQHAGAGWHAWQFGVTTTSAAEQSAGAAYSQGRRRELQLPAVFTKAWPRR